MELKEEIRNIILQILELPVSALAYDTEMNEVAEWDSIHNVIILSTLEERYGILFPDDDLFGLTSVNALASEIARLKA
jgi:acyl carrier protein